MGNAALENKEAESQALREALESVKGVCFEWSKYRKGNKWVWDCDTPKTVIEAYNIADAALTKGAL